ncbi:PLP-dependent aminotransferase family protein [Longitalea luteola]|uniref:aminotransferase-like domain-containing protein n=1 Tax=Longitalea luteola TaxID=2812563 RepID=UPI001A97BEEB|nr:PLP-dependent aminotransferase family protein [Longitalea luteola]
MLPWKTIIQMQKDGDTPVYLQIANSVIQEMRKGRVGPGLKLPGTRQMAEMLQVHRKTIVRAYEELDAQGWIEMHPSKGTFTSKEIPETKARRFSNNQHQNAFPATTGYTVKVNTTLRTPALPLRHIIGFHDGPDMRLIPADELGRAYKSVLSRHTYLKYMSYVETPGVQKFRQVLSDYLNATRGLQTTFENILVTRGAQMALYLLSTVLFAKGDTIIVGDTNYYYADHVFIQAGMQLTRVKVDEYGMDVDAVEKVCQRKKIKALYITSHHHYPTTVTLSAARRIKLLSLAEKYGFIIIEDDYDYDFHYLSSPMLPLVSADTKGMVIYIGTLSKTVAPAIRTGYVVAPQNLILELSRIRQLVDVQGDPIMELALVDLFEEGHIKRHMKKALLAYHKRRDFLCGLLKDKLSDMIDFKIPDGGLAIWAKFNRSIPLPTLAEKLKAQGLILSNGLIHNTSAVLMNATRMGFGWMNEQEAEQAVDLLVKTIRAK